MDSDGVDKSRPKSPTGDPITVETLRKAVEEALEQPADQLRLPQVVANNVPLELFNLLTEEKHAGKLEWEAGTVRIVEVVGRRHDGASRAFFRAVDSALHPYLSAPGSGRLPNGGKEPDESWYLPAPPGGGGGAAPQGQQGMLLSLVLEIANAQSGVSLRARAPDWFLQGAREVVLIHIDQYWAEVHRVNQPANPVQFVRDFRQCNAPNQPNCMLQLSLANIYNGAQWIPFPIQQQYPIPPDHFLPVDLHLIKTQFEKWND